MGKKKSRGKTSDSVGDDFSDTSSMYTESVVSNESEDVQEAKDAYTVLSEKVDELTEKRSSTREEAIVSISKMLTTKWIKDDLLRLHETCSANLLTCIRKGSGKEVAMAADTLARTLITVGYEGEPEKHMDYLGGAIWSAISKAKTAGAKAALLRTYSIIVFLGSEDERDTLKRAAEISAIFVKAANNIVFNEEKGEYELVSKAFGNLPKLRVKGSLEKLLYHSSLDVRESAGEALAFLFEALHEESDQVNGEAAASEGMDISNMTSRLATLSTESNKGMKKKERSHQRRAFRNILDAVSGNDPVEEKIKVGKETFLFETWSDLKRLDLFREVLAEGTHIHLQKNELVRDVLSLGPPSLNGIDEETPSSFGKKADVLRLHAVKRSLRKGREKDRAQREVAKFAFVDNPHFDD